MTSPPTSQALTPTDEKLEFLLDEFERRARMMALIPGGSVYLNTYEATLSAARAALREYVSATTLTEEEAQSIMAWCYNSQPTVDMSSQSKPRNSALIKLRRRASMKENPEK